MEACLAPGSWRTRLTAAITASGACLKSVGKPMFWPSVPTIPCGSSTTGHWYRATLPLIADDLEADQWHSLAAGEGAKGPRLYDWTRIPFGEAREDGFERWVLVRRSQAEPTKLAYYFAYAPAGTSLTDLAGAAGLHWTIEECFLRAKDDLGLDHCEARSWHGWHRHVSLVMAAAAFLARLSADQRRAAFSKWDKTSPNAAA